MTPSAAPLATAPLAQSPMVVALAGGTGFVGRTLAARLVAAGHQVRILTRRPVLPPALAVLPGVERRSVARAVTPEARVVALAQALQGCSAVVNLVGILHESGRQTFQAVHVDAVAQLVEATRQAGIHRFVQVSALGAAPDAPSAYLRSRAGGEAAVRASALDWTVLQPSVIFGRDDTFLNQFARLLGLVPVMALACPQARFQPVYVGDVAQAVLTALADPRATGQTLQLGGPEVFTLRELVEQVGAWTGHRPPLVPLGPTGSLALGALMELAPVPLMTRDNVRSMQVPNVVTQPVPDWLAWQPASLRALVPAWLTPRPLSAWRAGAGR